MESYLNYLQNDLENYNLPRKTSNFLKIKCPLKSGKRIYWYFEEDFKFFNDEGENIEDHKSDIFSGIVVGAQDVENTFGELNAEDCIVVMDQYPVEMSYPQFTWITMKRLIDDNDLVEIIE